MSAMTLRLPDDLHRRLRVYAWDNNQPVSQVIVNAVRLLLDLEESAADDTD